jgi:hypothetical protein
MSRRPIDRSPDLRQLRDEGFDLRTRAGYLVLSGVPYVAGGGTIARGTLVDALNLNGDVTNAPSDHTMLWVGETPCDHTGQPLGLFVNSAASQHIDGELTTTARFSAKPATPDADYHAKFTRYIRLIATHAEAIDGSVTAATFPVIETEDGEAVFRYVDTASSRAHITALSEKLAFDRVAIVGLGGTGSYILDLVAKTDVKEVHLFDADILHQHNAFRSPGAPSIEELRTKPTKVAYYERRYSALRSGITGHPCLVTDENAHELLPMGFVFLALDQGTPKRALVAKLEQAGIPFIDVGMAVYEANGALDGVLRVTTSTPHQRSHVWEKHRIPFSDGNPRDEYAQDIQVADLNALNAAFAVIKWKKLAGFYHDAEHEFHSLYTLDGNHLLNEDCA